MQIVGLTSRFCLGVKVKANNILYTLKVQQAAAAAAQQKSTHVYLPVHTNKHAYPGTYEFMFVCVVSITSV